MSMESAFDGLRQTAEALASHFENLLWVVSETKPPPEEHRLADYFEELITELVGLTEEAKACVAAVKVDQRQWVQVGRALVTCHERLNRISQSFVTDVNSVKQMEDLARLGHEHADAWLVWATNVQVEICRCVQPLCDAHHALWLCWQEFVERANARSLSVRAMSIGQQIVTSADVGRPPEAMP